MNGSAAAQTDMVAARQRDASGGDRALATPTTRRYLPHGACLAGPLDSLDCAAHSTTSLV